VSDYKYILFVLIQKNGAKKITKTWEAHSSGIVLGTVKWWAHWRRYCFFPKPEMLFDANCLWDIADFCSRMTTEQKEDQAKRRGEKQ